MANPFSRRRVSLSFVLRGCGIGHWRLARFEIAKNGATYYSNRPDGEWSRRESSGKFRDDHLMEFRDESERTSKLRRKQKETFEGILRENCSMEFGNRCELIGRRIFAREFCTLYRVVRSTSVNINFRRLRLRNIVLLWMFTVSNSRRDGDIFETFAS